MTRAPDLVCLSHLRWDSVYQRPQHLMTRFARKGRVFFLNEVQETDQPPYVGLTWPSEQLVVATPMVPGGVGETERYAILRRLIDGLFRQYAIRDYVLWYYTPMALPCTRHLAEARAIVYDCMDELSGFKNSPGQLRALEAELFARADVVFTGGRSLYEAKRHQHRNVHAFPSSVDVDHFAAARQGLPDPADQAGIPHPRLGFCGVIDERMDLDLVRGVAEALPAWHLVFLGPVAKIGRHTLPTGTNIHYLGSKQYADIPSYLAGWDVAWLPFARNDATRFISPTKTPEYLAAGKPVVSTAIRDVVHPYGERGLVQIADDVPATLAALTRLTAADDSPDRERVDAFLSTMSWDRTWRGMATLIDEAAQRRIAKRVMLDTMVTGGREATRSLPVSAAVSMSVPGGE